MTQFALDDTTVLINVVSYNGEPLIARYEYRLSSTMTLSIHYVPGLYTSELNSLSQYMQQVDPQLNTEQIAGYIYRDFCLAVQPEQCLVRLEITGPVNSFIEFGSEPKLIN
jgi:hypothetical protein